MLHDYIEQFSSYCQASDFPAKSIEALTARLGQFHRYYQTLTINSITEVSYEQLLVFVTDFDTPSVHVKKSRVWALRHFYRFLKLQHLLDENIAAYVPYPKIAKKVPQYLTSTEFNQILRYFASQTNTATGLRDLIVIMLFGFLGLRMQGVLRLNVEDVDLEAGLIRIREKGSLERLLPLPGILCKSLASYLGTLDHSEGQCPLLRSKRRKRISERTVQDLLRTAFTDLGMDKHLHAHLFRHTAATYLNKVGGPDVTQHLLGHATRRHTVQYTHLNPDIYAVYMKRHPYMNL
jgi:integrase/recombinase XerC